MGRNHLVYGENTEITYLTNIMLGFIGVCGTLGTILFFLGQVVFGGIAVATVVLIGFMVWNINRKQYQKVDGSFLYNEKEVSIHIDIYGKMRKKKPVVVHYGEDEIPMQFVEGRTFAKKLAFMLDENTPCVLTINRIKRAVSVTIDNTVVVDNNYVNKEYKLPNE